MPTTKPRHVITETDEVSAALAAAADKWPELRNRPGELLRRLVAEGHRALKVSVEARRRAVLATSGILAGAYPENYLEELREDWPA